MKIHVKVPATSANLGPGFDCMAIALRLYNEVWVEKTDEKNTFEIEGEGKGAIPEDENNLLYRSFKRLYDEERKELPKISVKQLNRIPLERGLGSSAAAIIAGLLAASKLSGAEIKRETILKYATEIEGHPDNVAAALLGGMTVAYNNGSDVFAESFKPHESLSVIVLVPKQKLSTEMSRSVIPQNIPIEDAVFNIGRVSLLTAGILEGRIDLLAEGMKDTLHQPHRTKLLPHYDETIDILKGLGIEAAALSGAGPSIIAFIKKESIETIKTELNNRLSELNSPYSPLFLEPDLTGTI